MAWALGADWSGRCGPKLKGSWGWATWSFEAFGLGHHVLGSGPLVELHGEETLEKFCRNGERPWLPGPKALLVNTTRGCGASSSVRCHPQPSALTGCNPSLPFLSPLFP